MLDLVRDDLARVRAHLYRALGHARRLLAAGVDDPGDIAQRKDLGMPGHAEVPEHLDPPEPVALALARIGDLVCDGFRLYARGPEHRARIDPLAHAVFRFEFDALGID